MSRFTDPAHQKYYDEGYQSKLDEIIKDGFNSARDSFNEKYPTCVPIKPTERYYTSCGEIDALLKFVRV